MNDIYSDVDDIPGNLNIQPYTCMFEPPAQANNDINTEEDSGESEDENDRLDRRRSTIW